jgi:hypothetical protein
MAIEAPYKGRDAAPAQADKAEAVATDKPEAKVEPEPRIAEADKRNAPPAETEPVETEEIEPEEQEEEVEPSDVETETDTDLILMRADYSKKTAAVKDRQRAIDAKEQELAQRYGVYEQVDAMIAANPELARTHTVEQLVAIVQSPNAPQRGTVLPPEVRRELDAMRREVSETKESLFVDRVESSVKRVAKEYGLKPEQVKQLVKFAVEDDLIAPGIPPERINRRLVLLARGMTYKGAEAKGQAKLVKTLKDKGRAASGGRTTATSPAAAETQPTKHKGWAGLIAKHQQAVRSG